MKKEDEEKRRGEEGETEVLKTRRDGKGARQPLRSEEGSLPRWEGTRTKSETR